MNCGYGWGYQYVPWPKLGYEMLSLRVACLCFAHSGWVWRWNHGITIHYWNPQQRSVASCEAEWSCLLWGFPIRPPWVTMINKFKRLTFWHIFLVAETSAAALMQGVQFWRINRHTSLPFHKWYMAIRWKLQGHMIWSIAANVSLVNMIRCHMKEEFFWQNGLTIGSENMDRCNVRVPCTVLTAWSWSCVPGTLPLSISHSFSLH